MKFFLEKFLSLLPYAILVLIISFLIILIYQNNLTYKEYLGITQVLIWPAIVLCGLLFFRRVFTYLFLSMEEFNFFGTRGKLKDISQVIEERVQKRITEQKNQEKSDLEIKKIASELEDTKKEKADTHKIAEGIFEKYKELSGQYTDAIKELNLLRQERDLRQARRAIMAEKIRRIRTSEINNLVEESSVLKADKEVEPVIRDNGSLKTDNRL